MSERVMGLTVMLLAGDLVSCGMQPPLLPTPAAMLRLLYVVGEGRTGELLRAVPCNEATLFQQLKRLRDAGLVDKRGERWRDGRVVKVYRLSGGGRRMVEAWERAAEDAYLRVTNYELRFGAKLDRQGKNDD